MKETLKGNLLFVGGDLSGIQKFIYNVSSKKAAVSLKGRSKYLCQYTREVYDRLTNLPPVKSAGTEEVYCSSGKFYFITSDTAEIREAITQCSREIESALWKEQHGQLAIAICYVPFVFAEDGKQVIVNEHLGSIGLLWSSITPLFAAQKKQSFRHILTTDYDQMFDVIPVGGDVKVCTVTGIESADCIEIPDNKDSLVVLPVVKKQIELGEQLRNKEHFKTFEEYAEKTYLGILRMDVDGLGSRFIRGFKDLNEYTQFSELLKRFFDKRHAADANNVYFIQQKDYYRNDLNIIYAGGDDLFAVGRWDKIIEFAAEVRQQFMQHMQGEGVTISGGIAIVHPKFPIAKAALLAGEAEDNAKSYILPNRTPKNAFCFFGETISWEKEYDDVLQFKNALVCQIGTNGVSKGLLHQLMRYAEMAKEGKHRYIWHSTYYLTRMLKETKDENAKKFLKELRDTHMTQGMQHMKLIALAARWAEQEIRIN